MNKYSKLSSYLIVNDHAYFKSMTNQGIINKTKFKCATKKSKHRKMIH